MDTKKLRQKILDLAIHGKLVPQNPNDEPASVLLERIRAEKERLIAEGKIKRSKKSATSDTSHYENVPFEVPEGWCWCKLEDIAQSNIGLTYKPADITTNGTPVLRSNNIQNNKLCLDDVVRVTTEIRANQFVSKGDLLICARNGSRRLVGKCALINTLDEQCSFGAFMAVCKSLYNEWLFHVLCSTYFSQYLDDSNSTTIYQVTQKMLLDLPVPFPPIQEQKRIATEIEKYINLIDLLEESKHDLNSTILQAKSKILDLAIHGKLVPQDANDEPASKSLKRINPKAVASCDNPHYGNIPSSWVYTTMGSIFQHNTGKALNKSASTEGALLPYLTTSNVYWNTFDLSVVKEMRFKESEIEKCTIIKGDLLVCEGGDIGRAAIWNKDYSICIQNHLHRLRPKGDVVPLLYLYYLMYLKLTNKIEGKGIGLQGFSSGLLDKLEVPLPPYNEQIRIVDRIQEAFNQLDSIAESLV